MKKVQKLLILVLCLALLGAFGLFAVACGGDDANDGKLTVTFYDATGTTKPSEMTVLKTEKVEKGATVQRYTPTRADGYEFVNWFATPSKSHKFDFSEPIEENVSIYAGFSKFVADTRDFYVIGSGTSAVLLDGWGVINSAHKFTKTEGKNEYKLTLDLKTGDEFVLVENAKYYCKRGAGYLDSFKLADGTEVFEGIGSVYDDSTKGANIKVKHDGNYTLTLTTHPNEDYHNTAGQGYTEEGKQIYNLSPYDTISWVRNGDVLQETVVVTDLFIKGANITGWANVCNGATKMANDAGVRTLSVYLKANEEFMFASQNTSNGVVTSGSINVNFTNIAESDTASKAFVKKATGEKNNNIVAIAAGTYTFTYTDATKVLTVAFDATKIPEERDYYLDGAYGSGINYGDYQKDTTNKAKFAKESDNVYTLKALELKKDDEILIRSYPTGTALEAGNYGDKDYKAEYLASSNAIADQAQAKNIVIKKDGTYNITFNSYSQLITITEDTPDIYDIYVKGENIYNEAGNTMSSWAHGFKDEWRMTINADETAYEFIVTTDGSASFGLELHSKGETTGTGTFINTAKMGTAGDANSLFGTSGNFACSTDGTYKIVYTIATETVDFYAVEE